MKLRLLCSILLLFSFGKVFAQNYPVQVTPQFLPPSPIYLSSYADGTTINSPLRVQLLLNDITLSNREVRLKIYIEGTGINLQGSDLVIGSESIYLDGGVPLTLTNELAPYFELKNMRGINPANYANPLPEGNYQFCFEVYDAFTGNRLSNKTCTSTLIFHNDPPFLNIPFKDEEIPVNNPQNIVFQWTPRHINVSNVEYELSIVEIWDHYVDPQAAFFSMPPIFQVTTRNTSYLMGPSDPPLLPNKKYAWRVQAKALQGVEEVGLFKNKGYSEIYWFNHTQPCEAPAGLYAELKGASKVNVFWEPNPEAYKSYTIAYREAGDRESDWYLKTTNSDWITLWDLKPGTTYEYMIKGTCLLGESEYSESQLITTELLDNSDSYYSCGLVPDEIAITNREPLPTLISGEEIYAGDFVVTIASVTGSNGIFSGRGYVKIPYLNLITLGVTFNSILVNTDRQLAEGEIVTLYDPAFGEGAEMTVDVSLNFSNASTLDYEDIHVDGEIQSVSVNSEGNIVVQTTSGPVTINTQGENSSGGDLSVEPGTPVKIKDDAGNEYTVVDGVVTQGGGESITNENSKELTGAGKAMVTFEKASQSQYGLDKYKTEYEGTRLKRFYPEIKAGNKNYFVSWKALASGKMEPLLAKIDVKENGLDLNKISFETNAGAKYTSRGGTDAKERTVQLAGKGNMQEEELYALYPTDSTALTLGRINTVSYDEVRHKVIVVPLGNTKYPGSASELQNGLNIIYSQAAVSWDVELQTPLEVSYGSPLIVGEKGNNYIRSLKEIINAYKRTKPVNKNTYYLFIADKLQNETGKDVDGYMLRGGQYGFIAANSQNIVKTIAHELGHGAFHLKHAFSKYNVSETSDNLMSYSNGFELVKDQWDDIHNPALIIGLLESDEDGEQATVVNIEALKDFANEDGTFTFISRSGKPITVPGDITEVTFSTGDATICNNDEKDPFRITPFGTLSSFVYKGEKYNPYWKCVSKKFEGYGKGENDIYIDSLTNIKIKEALIGFPTVVNNAIIFKVGKIGIQSQQKEPNYMAKGDYQEFDFLSQRLKEVVNFKEVIAKFDPDYDQEVQQFIIDNIKNDGFNGKGFYDNDAYVFIHATQLQKYSILKGCFKTGVPGQLLHFIVYTIDNKSSYSGGSIITSPSYEVKAFKDNYEQGSEEHNAKTLINHWKQYDLNYYPKIAEQIKDLQLFENATHDELIGFFNSIFNVNYTNIKSDNWDCFLENIGFEKLTDVLIALAEHDDWGNETENLLLKIFAIADGDEIRERILLDLLEDYNKDGKKDQKLLRKIVKITDDSFDNSNPQFTEIIGYISKWLINRAPYDYFNNTIRNFEANYSNFGSTAEDHGKLNVVPTAMNNMFGFAGQNNLSYKIQTYFNPDGKINIQVSSSKDTAGSLSMTFNNEYSPYDYVVLNVWEDFSVGGRKIEKGYVLVPSIFAHWLAININGKNTEAVLRVIFDVCAIVAAPLTGGSSLLVITLEAGLATADIIFTITNNVDNQTPLGNDKFFHTWTAIYGIYNLYQLKGLPKTLINVGETAGKAVFNFIKEAGEAGRLRRMIINPAYLDDFIADYKLLSRENQLDLILSLDELALAVKKENEFTSLSRRILYQTILDFRLECNAVFLTPKKLDIVVKPTSVPYQPTLAIMADNNLTGLANITLSEDKVINIIESSRWLPVNTNSRTIATIDNVKYTFNGSQIIGKIDVVEDLNNPGQFYLNKINNVDEARGVTKSEFIKSLSYGDDLQKEKLWEIWAQDNNSSALFDYMKTNKFNIEPSKNNMPWPPFSGFKSVKGIFKGDDIKKEIARISGKEFDGTFDRFQENGTETLGGGFASPVYKGEYNKIDIPYTYDSRAMLGTIEEGTVYIKFKIKDYSGLEFKYGEALPWKNKFGKPLDGNADQVEILGKKFHNLEEGLDYEIVQKSIYRNGKWEDIVPDRSLIRSKIDKLNCE